MTARRRSGLSTALTAGALQDHLLNDLALGDLTLGTPLRSYAGLKKKLTDDERKRKQALKNVKATVDTGRTKQPRASKREDKVSEYVLDPAPKPSLAQKLGLVSKPESPLTEKEWKSVKQKSIEREDFKNPCAICQEHFAKEDQVLLSCSHVFHKTCIRAFERFTGRKTCPMCRKMQYQARVVHDGTKVFKEKAAVRIQSFWRGHVVRRWYRRLRKTVPPKDSKLRKRFYEEKLQEITDRMVAMTNGETVDRFLREIDNSVASSRAVFQHFEDTQLGRMTEDDWLDVEVKALQRDDPDCPICLRSLKSFEDRGEKNEVEWKIPKQTFKETQDSCTKTPNKVDPHSNPHPSIALLSCSHTFHAKCLEALEDFHLMESLSISPSGAVYHNGYSPVSTTMDNCYGANLRCPVCRSLYVKRITI